MFGRLLSRLPTFARCVNHSAEVWSVQAVEIGEKKRGLLWLQAIYKKKRGLLRLQPVERGRKKSKKKGWRSSSSSRFCPVRGVGRGRLWNRPTLVH